MLPRRYMANVDAAMLTWHVRRASFAASHPLPKIGRGEQSVNAFRSPHPRLTMFRRSELRKKKYGCGGCVSGCAHTHI